MIQLVAPFLADGHWIRVRDGDPDVRQVFDRHYSRRKNKPSVGVNANKFAGPGETIVLRTATGDAVFVWRLERYRQDEQAGINCAVFRNEGPVLSSDIIREACAIAWQRWPGQTLYTYVNAQRIRSSNPGYCFIRAGWRRTRRTLKGLYVLEIEP